MEQTTILKDADSLQGNLTEIIPSDKISSIFVVHGKSYSKLAIARIVGGLPVSIAEFGSVSPNPDFGAVRQAVAAYRNSGCGAILAVGGGSVIDIAKCVKLFAFMPESDFFDPGRYRNNHIPLIAMPTTAGSGSEATHFAVIYKDKIKRSVAHESLLPDYVFLLPGLLDTLPAYQRKCAFLDALCHAVEAWWSVNATSQSIGYSREALSLLTQSYESYSGGDNATNSDMLIGANYAGRAINIAQTAAAHALSYNLTSDLGLPHGHAVALCLPATWRCMEDALHKIPDLSERHCIRTVFQDISIALGYNNPEEAIEGLTLLLKRQGMGIESHAVDRYIDKWESSANLERLKNSPVRFDRDMICSVYRAVSETMTLLT